MGILYALLLGLAMSSVAAARDIASGGVLEVRRPAYLERYEPKLDINAERSPLVGLQYGDPREVLTTPILTLHGVQNSHRHICAFIQHVGGGYTGILKISNPRRGPTLRLHLPMTVLQRWSPHAGELAILAKASSVRSDCSKGATLLLASFTTAPVESSPIYALANFASNVSASAKLLPAPEDADVAFCERVENVMQDVRLNPQRFGSLCRLRAVKDCSEPQTLQIIVRDDHRRIASPSEPIRGTCVPADAASPGS